MIERSIEAFDQWHPASPSEEELQEVGEQALNAWQYGLRANIISRSSNWTSEHSHLWDQKRLIADYANQFSSAMQQEIDQWGNQEIKANILDPALQVLEMNIRQELAALQNSSVHVSGKINARFSDQLSLIIGGINDDISGAGGFLGGGAAGIALATGLYAFTMVAIVPIIIAGVAAAVVGTFGLGLMDVDGIHDKIKLEVIERGFSQFEESLETIYERLGEIIGSAFQDRVDAASNAIERIISCYENALQVNEKSSHASLAQAEIDKKWIAERRLEVEQIQQELKVVLSKFAE